MTTQPSLFDVRPIALAREPETEVQEHRESAGGAGAPSSKHPAILPDVARVIVHKSGKPNPVLVGTNGVPTGREFWLVQLNDGSYAWQYTDNGERGPATKATHDISVSDMLRTKDWTEVTG